MRTSTAPFLNVLGNILPVIVQFQVVMYFMHWWGSNNISTTESLFCIAIDSNQMDATRRPALNVVAEVFHRSSSGGFTSRLVRQNISTELNNTVIGCSRSENSICTPSSTDQNPNFSLSVTVCQGNNNSRKQYISHIHQQATGVWMW